MIFATGNKDKAREIGEILGRDVDTMSDAGIDVEIIEDGKTFAENSLIKARTVAEAADYKDIVLADDSGLEIDALGKEPGVYSARYLGEDTPYEKKNAIILQRLADVPQEDRTARFVCAMSAVLCDGRELSAVETMEGHIAFDAAGENGFGYDPIFVPDGYDVTSAQLSPQDKNSISHRGKAMRRIKAMLEEVQS